MKNFLKTFALSGSLIAFALFNQSCNKLIPAQDVKWNGKDIIISVPIVTDTTAQQNMGTGSFTYNLDSFIKAESGNSFNISNLNSAKVVTCTLSIPNADTMNNFANFQSADIYFSSNSNATVAHVGTITNNPDVYADTLIVPVDNSIDLKSYMNGTSATTINYGFKGKLRRPTTKPLTVVVHMTFTMNVKS